MPGDPITTHFFSGFIRLHVLHHAATEAIYGAEIAEELRRHGYRVSQGTLYPMLHALEQQGFLRRQDRLVAGRRRKYYHATAAGRRVLVQARRRLQELVAEVLHGEDGPFQAIREKHQSDGPKPRPGRKR